jgi:hypothetical protein
MFIFIEVLLPIIIFSIIAFFAHRSRFRKSCFSNGFFRGMVSSIIILFVTVLYGRIVIWCYFYVYWQIATEYGHQALGSSWDIRLTYTMPTLLFFLIAIAVLILFYELWIILKEKLTPPNE